MRISKTELLNALNTIKPGLANSDAIEQTTTFAFIIIHNPVNWQCCQIIKYSNVLC